MTTFTAKSDTAASWPMFAALGAGLSVVLTALGTFWDFNGNDPGGRDGIGEYLIVVGIIAVATAIVFAVARRPSPVKALVLGVLSVLSIVVFWAGLPAVLAAGSVASATGSRMTAAAKTGVGLSALAAIGAVVLAFTG